MALVELARAVNLLRAGELVAIPTETVYGLAGRYDCESALRAIFTTKDRPFFDPLIVHIANVEEARALASAWTAVHDRLAQTFWPGPLTLVVPKARHVSDLITSGLDTVGVRCPSHPLALEVLRATGPLAAPSANRFGRTSPTRAADVEAEFESRVSTLDGGPCAVGVESTVALVSDSHVDILRPGGVGAEDIQSALGSEFTVGRRHSVRSPGHLEAHYQPANRVILVDEHLSAEEVNRRGGGAQAWWLELPTEAALAARVLYAEFRRLSGQPGLILIRDSDRLKSPAFEAVYDRVRRAAGARWT